MSQPVDPFLNRSAISSRKGALGRVFGVVRETWALSDDPAATPPRTTVLVSRRTAAEAADMARDAAAAFRRHGFHKPSGAWWGADDALIHRFVIHARRHRGPLVLLAAAGLAGLVAAGLARRRTA
jgi:hypothetical protein